MMIKQVEREMADSAAHPFDNWNSVYYMTNDTLVMKCSYCGKVVWWVPKEEWPNKICPFCKGTGVVKNYDRV